MYQEYCTIRVIMQIIFVSPTRFHGDGLVIDFLSFADIFFVSLWAIIV